jgi:hypothetical protein
MRIVRILRGIVKTALTWAVVWVPFSLIPFGLATLLGGGPLPPGILGPLLISQAVMGAINGGVFASVLAIAGRRKSFETLSLPWIAACGAVGAALIPFAGRAVLFATLDVPIPATALVWTLVTNAVLGAGCATVTLSLARRAPALPRGSGAVRPALDAGAA